jgi:drug/metabolite transporter (DMT)-like permease
MSRTADITVAVLAAVGAAGAFGVGVVLQYGQARAAPREASSPWRLLTALARRRVWLAGIALAVAAYGLQALALAFGPLVLVAPIVGTDLMFALPLAALITRRPMPAAGWAGCALVGVGVAVFVTSSPPSSGRADAPAQNWVLAFGLVALVAGAAIAVGAFRAGAARTAYLAIAAGVIFGLTAAVTLSLTRVLRHGGAWSLLTHWQPWALLVLGVAGLSLSASAYQAGALAASLPIMDTVEPVFAVLLGTLVFGERLATSIGGLALQVTAGAAATVGIVLVGRADRSALARVQRRDGA